MILHRKQVGTESEEFAGKTVWRIKFENLEETTDLADLHGLSTVNTSLIRVNPRNPRC